MKSKSLTDIEQKMGELDPNSLRYQVLDSSRQFKNSWIDLGRYLYQVNQSKLYKEWGFLTFEAYTAKEVGIRQQTAVKLLKSYFFLEKEEPQFLKKQLDTEEKPNKIPSYEAVNALRLASQNDRIPEKDYDEIRDAVLEDAREEGDVKKKIRYVLKANPAPASDKPVDKEKMREQAIIKTMATLKRSKDELADLGFPQKLLNKFDDFIDVVAEYQL
jgi:hypothetical protein